MYQFVEYISSFLIWTVLLISIAFLIKKVKRSSKLKLDFIDFIFVGLFVNAVFYLIGIKSVNFFSIRFDQNTYEGNEPWGIIAVEFFFEKIINWILILLTLTILAFRKRR